MLKLRYYNEAGEVCFGGGKSSDIWRLTNAEGLSFPERSFQSASYGGMSGEEITKERTLMRTITLSGDIIIDGNFEAKYNAAMKVLYSPGTLEVVSYGRNRKIGAVCAEFRHGERKGKYQLFAVQFICENPYFEAADSEEVSLYKIIPMLSSETELPAMFSKRISRSSIYYGGNVKTEPVFYIKAGQSPEGVLEIINHTSGERLCFDYTPLGNEFITIDVKNRKIYNSDGESLLEYLSNDSFFDGFCLYPGINDIEVLLGSFNEELDVSCQYAEMFLEAVI